MYVDIDVIIKFGALLGVLCTCAGLLYKGFRWIDKQKLQDTEIAGLKRELEDIKKENCAIVYGLLAALDGLMQLGANGNVTHAHTELEKHINKQAHNIGR